MRTLYLIRHAKSSWEDPTLDDFDRPLNRRGKRDAPMMGNRLRDSGVDPDLVISSPARRAVLTAWTIAKAVGYEAGRIETDEAIYGAEASRLLGLIRRIDDANHRVMLFGHNPGLTWLAVDLTDAPIDNMPTCAVCGILFDVASWREIERGAGEIILFDYPKKKS